jgi:hypothetical protein
MDSNPHQATTPPSVVQDEQNTPARALRRQALEVLQEAERLDGLKAFTVTHVYMHGEGHWVVWARQTPVLAELQTTFPDFEPDLDEFRSVSAPMPLQVLVGLSLDVPDRVHT